MQQPSHSPTLTGFRFMFRRPSLGLAEVAWRWSFGFAAALLLTLSFLEYLHTLPVSSGDLLFLRTNQPALISKAILHILRGSAPRAVDALLVLGVAMAGAWIAIAALGRAVTLRAVASYLREDIDFGDRSWRTGSLAGLNFLRMAASLAAGLGGVAALLIASAVSPDGGSSPGVAVLIFLVVMLLVWLAWSVMNWLLSFAAIFVVARRQDTFGAIAAAIRLPWARVGPVLAVSTWFGLAHGAAFVVASSAVAFPLALAGLLPPGLVLFGVLLVTLLYFAAADFLYVGRLAAYVAIIDAPDALPVLEIAAPVIDNPRSAPPTQPDGQVDTDELILSDQPASN
jgi:hypothetical protein